MHSLVVVLEEVLQEAQLVNGIEEQGAGTDASGGSGKWSLFANKRVRLLHNVEEPLLGWNVCWQRMWPQAHS